MITDVDRTPDKFKPIEQLQDEAHGFAATCVDGHALTSEMAFIEPMGLGYRSNDVTPLFDWLDVVDRGGGMLTDHAFGQLTRRLDIPTAWAANSASCPSELRAQIVNWKLKNVEEKKMLVRCRQRSEGDYVRAYLSSEYTPYDHHHLLDAIVDALGVVGGSMRFFRGDVDDELKAYLLVENVKIDGGDERGGGLHPAVYISNSEIGGGSLRIAPAVYRSICSNGAIFGWHQTSETFRAIHRWVTPKQMSFKVNEAIAAALKLAPEMAVAFLDTQATRLERTKIADLIEDMTRKYGLTVEARDLWKGAAQPAETLFDVINAATLTAQGRSNDERELMEVMGGEMAMAKIPYKYVDTSFTAGLRTALDR